MKSSAHETDAVTSRRDAEVAMAPDSSSPSSDRDEIFVSRESSPDDSRQLPNEEIVAEYHRLLEKQRALKRDIANTQAKLRQQDRELEEYCIKYGQCRRDNIQVTDEHVGMDMEGMPERHMQETGKLNMTNMTKGLGDGESRVESESDTKGLNCEATDQRDKGTKLTQLATDRVQMEEDAYSRAKVKIEEPNLSMQIGNRTLERPCGYISENQAKDNGAVEEIIKQQQINQDVSRSERFKRGRIPRPRCNTRGCAVRDASRFQRVSRNLYAQRSDYDREILVPERERHVMRSNAEYKERKGLENDEQDDVGLTDRAVTEGQATNRRKNSADRRRKVVKSKIDTGLGKQRSTRQEIRFFTQDNTYLKDTRNVLDTPTKTKPFSCKRKPISPKIDTGLKKTKENIPNKQVNLRSAQANLNEALPCSPKTNRWSKYNTLPPIKRDKAPIQGDSGLLAVHTDCHKTTSMRTSPSQCSQFIPTPPLTRPPPPTTFAKRYQKHETGIHSPFPPIRSSGSISPSHQSKDGRLGCPRDSPTSIRRTNTMTSSPPLASARKSNTNTTGVRTHNNLQPVPPIAKTRQMDVPKSDECSTPKPGSPKNIDTSNPPAKVNKAEALWISFSPSPPPGGAPKSRPRARKPKLSSDNFKS